MVRSQKTLRDDESRNGVSSQSFVNNERAIAGGFLVTETRVIARPNEDVVFTQLDNEEGVLLHLGNQSYYSLNVTGAHIWRLIASEHSLSEILQELQTVFDVSDEQARQSVLELVKELETQQLVTLDGDPQAALG